MNLTVATTTPVVSSPVDPMQPTLPGMETDVIARYGRYGDAPTSEVKIDRAHPLNVPQFLAFDDAVTAAQTIMERDRKDAREGLFNQRQGRVASIAVLEAKDGFQLVRSTLAVDAFKEEVPGSMFWPQYWVVSPPGAIVAEQVSTLTLVGWGNLVDLRSGKVVAPAPFPKP
ncbi:MAG: hypothetical protein JWL76_438 [Thermoleophilia bacterium]|nr:hypothetical protein [Thermoleophilia bacterium]